MMKLLPSAQVVLFSFILLMIGGHEEVAAVDYPIVHSGQTACYDKAGKEISCPSAGESYYGQDAQYVQYSPNLVNNGDGTISDLNTGLTWTSAYYGRTNWADGVSTASSVTDGGYTDWRAPTIKELYSIMNFAGKDISSQLDTADTSTFTPFIDTTYFDFKYGIVDGGNRNIDVQGITKTENLDEAYNALGAGWFGVNFADGRIKAYEKSNVNFIAHYVRGDNKNYGTNDFRQCGTPCGSVIQDCNTGLMWEQADSGSGMDWEAALAYCESRTTGGYKDWRLPSAKELHSIVDYTKAPVATGQAAIDTIFSISSITNEAGDKDWPYFWTSTTHQAEATVVGAASVYFCFGKAMGYYNNAWVDVHSAGAQKSDPKYDDGTDYSTGFGPQGDAIRITNYVRCVRTETTETYQSCGLQRAWSKTKRITTRATDFVSRTASYYLF